LPNPGVDCPPLAISVSASVELLTSSSGISGIYSGNVCDALRKAKENLASTAINEVDQAKSTSYTIIAGSDKSDFSSLTSSLNLLWNTVHALQQNGVIVLLAENQHGLGGALQMLVEGKMKNKDLYKRGFYVPGLEHPIYLENLRGNSI
jgi:hypothetical protein